MKKIVVPNKSLTVALLVVLSFFLTACSINDLPVIGSLLKKNPTKSQVTLNMWGMWESPEVMNTLISKYQEKNPNVKINYDDRSVSNPNEYKERVFARVKEEGQDIVRVHASWVPALKDLLAPADSSVYTPDTYSQTFYPAASQAMVIDGKVYGIPLFYDGLMLVYNKTHFDEADISQAPTAWEEFRKDAMLLTIRGEKNAIVRAGAAIGTSNNIDFFSDILGLMFVQAGVDIPSGLDSRNSQDALTYYTNFSKEDKVWDNSFPEASTAFAQEKVSMIMIPSWNLLDILKVRPDLKIGVAPIPQAISDKPASWSSFWSEVVPKTSKNQAAAWDFLKFLSEEEQQMMIFSEQSKYRSFGTLYSRSGLAPQVSSGSFLKPLAITAPYSKTGTLSARAGNAKQVNALKDAVNSVLSGISVSEALKTAKEIILK